MKIKNFTDSVWKDNARGVAIDGVYEKFRQNQPLFELLNNTSKSIYEASSDEFWGTGIHLKNRFALDKSTWKGNGLMFEVYEVVKEMLK